MEMACQSDERLVFKDIRTDNAAGGWMTYAIPGNVMSYSTYSLEHSGYSHYFCKWVALDGTPNVKFVVANDYGAAISDTIVDDIYTDKNGTLLNHGGASLKELETIDLTSFKKVSDYAELNRKDDALIMAQKRPVNWTMTANGSLGSLVRVLNPAIERENKRSSVFA